MKNIFTRITYNFIWLLGCTVTERVIPIIPEISFMEKIRIEQELFEKKRQEFFRNRRKPKEITNNNYTIPLDLVGV